MTDNLKETPDAEDSEKKPVEEENINSDDSIFEDVALNDDSAFGDEEEDAKNSADKQSVHPSLLFERKILVVDEEGPRRDETVNVVQVLVPNAEIEVANSPEEAHAAMEKKYDTYVVNLLMPGYSSSEFVKTVQNHDEHPLLVGFAADKMSDAFDPKKGIKVKPLRKLFEQELPKSDEEENGEEKS